MIKQKTYEEIYYYSSQMNITLISKDKKSMEIEIIGENETLLTPLKQKLLEDEKVDFATFIIGHRELDNPKLYVKVKEGKPQTALKRAARAIIKDNEKLKKKFEDIS